MADGAISLPLCGTRDTPIAAAEEILPRNLCPLIKISFGSAASDRIQKHGYTQAKHFFIMFSLIFADKEKKGMRRRISASHPNLFRSVSAAATMLQSF